MKTVTGHDLKNQIQNSTSTVIKSIQPLRVAEPEEVEQKIGDSTPG